MIENYANNPQLFARCIDLIDEIFPGCKEQALNGIKYNASWNKASTPFIIKEKDEIVAHAGIWPLTFILNGKEHHSASIHAVCVKPSHRTKGYFQKLMQEIMQYVEHHFNFSVLFTLKPYLYQKYSYHIMLPEYDFLVSDKMRLHANTNANSSDLKILHLDNPADLNLIHQLLTKRIPLSKQFSVIHENSKILFILNVLNKKIYYSEKFNTIIVYEIVEKNLYIKDIISEQNIQLLDILKLILAHEKKPINIITLQFCPDQFLNEKEYSAILARPECCMMTSNKFLFDNKFFRYPELYWC